MADKYPKTIPDFRSSIISFTPPEDLVEKFDELRLVASPPVQVLGVFSALKDIDDLDEDARELLAGAAYLITVYAFEGKASEAIEVLVTLTAGFS